MNKSLLSTILMALAIILSTKSWAQEPYAALSDNNTVLTFYYDDHKAERNGMDVGPFTFNTNNYSVNSDWFEQRGSITSVVFDNSFANYTTLTSTAYWFYDCWSLTTITGINNLKTDNVISMYYMFSGCSGLTSLDLSNFKTDNVTNMDGMFLYCSSLTSLDVSGFKTDNVTSMYDMFAYSSSLTSLDVSNFKTDNVTNMECMFYDCSGLTSLDVSGFNTENVTNIVGMFWGCSSLTNLDVTGFKTDNVTSMNGMFYGCSGLTNLDVSGFKTDNVRNMGMMFQNCSGLTSLDASGFNTDNVMGMDYMFSGCSGLTSLDVSGFKTDNVSEMQYMFYGCSSLTNLDVAGFKTDNVRNMGYMFFGCSGLTSIDVTGFKTDNVTNMGFMFDSCSGLTNLDLSNFKTSEVTYAPNNYPYSEGMQSMFKNCSSITTIWVSDGWTTANLSESADVFTGCTSLVGGAGTHYDENHTDYTYAHIDGGENNPGYFTSKNSLVPVKDAEPYAVLSDNNTVLTFYYDEHKAERNGMSVGPFEEMSERGWSKYISISTVVFDESFANCTTITSTQEWFAGMFTLEKIIGLEHLNTSNVTNMLSMFMTCQSLTSLDVSNFNTSKVTTMINMFAACHSLENLDVSNFNTSNVTHMGGMFIDCNALSSLDVSHFDTSNVTAMDGMFANCYSLSSLDVSNFNTSNVINMGGMFRDNPNLKSLDLSNFNTENVTDMQYMFRGCSNLTTINVSNKWSTANVTSSENMFNGCESLVGGAGTRYDANYVDISYAHIDGGENNPGYFTGVDNSLVAYYPFNGNANDESGHGNHGTPMENAALTVGVHGDANGAYQFGGTDNPGSIHVPNSESLQIGNEWSFATYVKPFSSAGMDGWGTASDYGWHAVLGHDHDQHGFSIQYEVSEDMFRTWIGHYGGGWNEGVEATVNGKPMNKWIHIAFTFANNVFRVYINGKMLTAFTTTPDFAEANTKDWYFGKYNNYWYPMNGILDEIRIYNRALRDDEVEDLAKYADKLEESGASFDGLTAWVSGDVPLEEAFMEVEGGREAAAQTIAAIVWENSYALTADMLQGINNPNLLVYVNEPSLAPQGIQNVVVNGQAQEIVLTDADTGNNNWYCPQAFTAERIRYTRNFGQQTEVGVSRGWESIALPFTVQEITHESKGQITPFGANGTKHFWLRGYSPDGLYSAATLEANKPYVISMPNNTVVYPDAYNLNGRVTFSASNTTVPATPPLEEMMVVRDNIIMMPTFQYIPQNEYIYAVNVGQARDRYAEGSVFARDLRDVRPFEAYTTHGERNGARPNFIRIAAQPSNESVGIRDIKTDSAESAWYSIDGRKLQGEPQRKGVYIQKGKKIRVK